jgi:xylulokinase
MDTIIGIDIGTTSTEGVLVSATTGDVLSKCSVSYQPGFKNPYGYPLGAEQRSKVWRSAALRVTNELGLEATRAVAEVRALAVSSMVGGLNIPVDLDFEPLRSVPIWLDQRAVHEARVASEKLDPDMLVSVTGNGDVSPYFGFTKLLWYMSNEKGLFRRTRALVTPQGMLIRLLTGTHVTDRSSLGAFGGVLDLERGDVSEEMLAELSRVGSKLSGEDLEVSPALFGKVVSPETVVGPITAGGAGLSGLPEGVPVVASGIDAAVSLLATGGRQPGDNTLIMGTSWLLGILSDRKEHRRVGGMVHVPHVLHGDRMMYSMTGGSYTGGTAGFWLPQMISHSTFDELEREAKLVPAGSGGVTFLPYLMGDRTPLGRTDAGGAFLGLKAEHNRGHLFRAVLEGGAIQHKECLEEAWGMGVEMHPTRIVDGTYGSTLWRGIIADVTATTVQYLPTFQGTAYGDAMLAAISVGITTEENAFGWLPEARTVEPTQDSNRLKAYGDALERYARYKEVLLGSHDVT